MTLLPTPKGSDGPNGGPGMRNGRGVADALPAVAALLPTPAVNDMGAGKTPEAWDEWRDTMRAKHGNGNGHGNSLAIEAQRLLPTPRSAQGDPRNSNIWERPIDQPQNLENALARDFGDYAPAVQRWADILGRPAPPPTIGRRLSPAFVEWMMGLPPGHVTAVPGLSHANQLKALGNGVVPQQAAHALRVMLP